MRFVITALAARWILNEEVSLLRWSGVGLIVIGACLVSYSELLKAAPPAKIPAANALPASANEVVPERADGLFSHNRE